MSIDLTTNISQIYTEVYFSCRVNPKPVTVFEPSIYLNSTTQASSLIEHASKELRSFHKRQGTEELYGEGDLVLGVGSTQLYKALEAFPYTNAKFQGFRDPEEIDREGKTIVEFVTSVNNPDGSFREPECNPDMVIADFVYVSPAFYGYIPNVISWVREWRKTEKPLFSFNSASKQFGLTGDRIGYMWIDPSMELKNKLISFLSFTVGVDSKGLSNFIDYVRVLPNKEVDEKVSAVLARRHKKLSEAFLNKYPESVVKSLSNSPTFFIDLKRENAAEVILSDLNVKVLDGTLYGESSSFVRLNLMASSLDIRSLLKRLGRKTKRCIPLPVASLTIYEDYMAQPEYNIIIAKKPLTIRLPDFLGYQFFPIKIKGKEIKVKTEKKTFCVKDKLVLYWKQFSYHDGEWSLTKNKERKNVPFASLDFNV